MDTVRLTPRALILLLLGLGLASVSPPATAAVAVAPQDGVSPLQEQGLSARIHDLSGLSHAADVLPTDGPALDVDVHGLHLRPALTEVSPGQFLLSVEPRLEPLASEPPAGLIEVLRTWIEPALEPPHGLIDCLSNGSLLVIGRPEQQEWVDAFLNRARAFDHLLSVRCRVYTLPRAALVSEMLTATAAEPGPAAAASDTEHAPVVLPAAAAEALVLSLLAQGGELVTEPSVVTRALQRATVSVVSQRSFVVGWSLAHVEPGRQPLGVHEIREVQEGAVLQVQVAPLGSGRFGLSLDLELTQVAEPVTQETLQLDPALPPVQWSLLEEVQSHAQARAELGLDAALVLTCSSPDDGAPGSVLVVVQLSLVPVVR